jgi:hypothetical protein
MKQNWILQITTFAALIIFAAYWFSTLLYVSPNNYIRIQFDDYLLHFEKYFYQNWAFFAPPPKANERLYYLFYNKKDSIPTHIYEALQPIFQEKKRKAPFNVEEEALDYILSSAIIYTVDYLREYTRYLKFAQPDSSEKFHLMEAHKIAKERLPEISTFKTLMNYAGLIAHKKNINLKSHEISLQIHTIDIPPFADRNKVPQDTLRMEKLLFQSAKFSLE